MHAVPVAEYATHCAVCDDPLTPVPIDHLGRFGVDPYGLQYRLQAGPSAYLPLCSLACLQHAVTLAQRGECPVWPTGRP